MRDMMGVKMRSPLRGAALIAVTVVGLGIAGLSEGRAEYPERPIKVVVCFAPAGVTDIAVRLMSNQLGDALGQSVVVENRPGAGGNIAMGAVAKATPDGYTLLACSSAFVVNPSLYSNAPYDPFKDFEPVSTVAEAPNVFVVSKQSNIHSFADFLKEAKNNPKFNYTSPGAGTTPYLAMEIMKLENEFNFPHIPFGGSAPAMQAVLSGDVFIMGASMGSVLPQIKDGQLRAIAQTGKTRWKDLPDVPTLSELGVKQGETDTFQAIFAPVGTPGPIVDKLSRAIAAVLSNKELQEKYRLSGQGVSSEAPDVLKKRIASQVLLYKNIIERAGLKIK